MQIVWKFDTGCVQAIAAEFEKNKKIAMEKCVTLSAALHPLIVTYCARPLSAGV